MQDQLLRALAFNDQVRVFVLNARESVEEARQRHDSWHTSTAAMGRTMVGALLLAANLKGNDQLTVKIKGNGPMGQIYVNADANGYVRAFVDNPHVALPLNAQGKIDVAEGVGLPGSLIVSKYIEDLEPFQGQVELISGEIAEDFTYYMAVSEQTPSSIGLSVLIDTDESVLQAGGFFIQILPDAEEETISQLEATIEGMGRFSDLLQAGLSLEDLLKELVGPDNYKVLAVTDVNFNCPCSQAYYGEKLELISKDDMREIIDQDQQAEIVCHYCGNRYHYDEVELEEIYQRILSKEKE